MSARELYQALKRPSLIDQAVEHLTDLVLSGRLQPGDFLPSETALSTKLNVSRSTVREAVRILETRGMVQRQHGVGIMVIDGSRAAAAHSINLMIQRGAASFAELLEIRERLESLSARLAASRATEDEIQGLASDIEAMSRASATAVEYVNADLDFHLRLAHCSHNAVLVALLDALRGLLRESILATYAIDGHTEQRSRAHSQILEAVASRNEELAERAMHDHLRLTAQMLHEAQRLNSKWGEAKKPDATRGPTELGSQGAVREDSGS